MGVVRLGFFYSFEPFVMWMPTVGRWAVWGRGRSQGKGSLCGNWIRNVIWELKQSFGTLRVATTPWKMDDFDIILAILEINLGEHYLLR